MTVPAGEGRAHPAAAYLALKAAVRRLTKGCGGQEAAAQVTRVDFQRIGRYGRPHEAQHAPVDVIADLEADSGEPMVTRVLADLQGYVLVPKPGARAVPVGIEHLGQVGREAGDVIAGLSDALADGEVTAGECRDLNLRRQVRELMEALATVDLSLERLEAEG